MNEVDLSGLKSRIQEIAQQKAQEILQDKLNTMKSYLQYEMTALYAAEQQMDANKRQGNKNVDAVQDAFFGSLRVVVDGMSGSIVGDMSLLSEDQSNKWKTVWLPNVQKRMGFNKQKKG